MEYPIQAVQMELDGTLTVECPHCGGEGFTVSLSGGYLTGVPLETVDDCEPCYRTGRQEIALSEIEDARTEEQIAALPLRTLLLAQRG